MPRLRRRGHKLRCGKLETTLERQFDNKWAWVDPADSLARVMIDTGESDNAVLKAFGSAFPNEPTPDLEEVRRALAWQASLIR